MTTAIGGAPHRYAQAAFEVAVKQRDVEGWLEDLRRLEKRFSGEFLDLFDNPRLDDGPRVALALTLAPDDLSPERLNLLKLLALGKRLRELPRVRQAFEAMVAEALGRVEFDVVVADEPDAEERARIEALVSESCGRDSSVRFTVDPAIIGGIVIRRGDHVIDGSVRRRLEELREQLVSQ